MMILDGYDTKLVIGTALVGVLVLALLTIFFSNGGITAKTTQQPTFLITGPAFSGKTCLFTKWVKGTPAETVASSAENSVTDLKLPFASEKIDTQYRLIDLPGNSKLWHLTANRIHQCRDNLLGILFVIDGAAGSKSVSSAAKELFRLLTITEKFAGGINILVAVNKSDVFNAIPAARITTAMEKEIEELRKTQSKGVGQVSENESEEPVWIGLDGQEFKFEQLEGEVSVLEGSVTANKTQKWQQWVEVHALNN